MRTSRAVWKSTSVPDRLRVVRAFRHRLADDPGALAATVNASWRLDPTTTLTAEIQPLLDACRFLEREASRLLAPRRLGRRGRPFWLFGSTVELRREPLGSVLILGPANYPILLPGVQALQALVAGNTVLVKPGRGGAPAVLRFSEMLLEAGLPEGALEVLPEAVAAGIEAIDAGVDKVVLTGSAATGRDVLTRLAGTTTPAVVELSGCDAVVVRADADLDLAARAVAFGMTFNGGFTCIAPRRLLVHRSVVEPFEKALVAQLAGRPAIPTTPGALGAVAEVFDDALARGARCASGQRPEAGAAGEPILLADVPRDASLMQADLGASIAGIVSVDGDDDAAELVATCRYRLGATVFGGETAAAALARRLDVGVVVVNDMIVPTADPRVPFGGSGASGFGRTRGAEGLLEMTTSRTVIVRGGKMRPHLGPTSADDAALFEHFIRLAHGRGLGSRLRAMVGVIREGRKRSR